ncbi:hypothetical protein YC2023_117983 [Brassica napus]
MDSKLKKESSPFGISPKYSRSKKFSSPSICEYPTLEGDLSSSKERPEAKPIIGVKRSLLAFHKAQDQEKWPRNYEVMIQSPKPVNPVLHLPQLEANRFNQLQTRHWRPGDHFNQSGNILGVQEEFCKFIPCTSNHWIMRILIYSNLPYLEQTAINVQQLFSLQIRHEIITYQAPRKVPRKLSYPLKPSRFKKNQVSHLEPKSHKRLQRLSTLKHQVNRKFIQFYQSCSLYKITVFRIQRGILFCLIDFVSLVCLCKSNKLSTQIERVNHFDPSFHQIERFNQTFLRKSTSVHHLIKLRGKFYLYTFLGTTNQVYHQSMDIFTNITFINRFSSPSICEYPTLEGYLSSSKERPEAKPIIGVKRSLLAFHKAQDQEKWPRNYEVMIQSPKPVNPVLHLPQLEANRFNQLQTRHWRPGDHFNQSGNILGVQEEFCKFIPCTSNHWIMRILIYSNLPYLEQTAINVQQLFSLQIRHEIRTYQAPRKVPRKLSYPLKPSRFKKNQVSHLEPKSHKRLQRLVFRFCYFA